jgi:hypothetical protein
VLIPRTFQALAVYSCFVLVACDTRSVNRTSVSNSVKSATSGKWPDNMEEDYVNVRDYDLKGDVNFLPNPRQARITLSWEDPLGNFPFAIYRGTKRQIKKVAEIATGQWSFSEIVEGQEGKGEEWYYAVGKSPDGRIWKSYPCRVGLPLDEVVKKNEVRRHEARQDRLFLGDRSRLLSYDERNQFESLSFSEIHSLDGSIETFDRLANIPTALSARVDNRTAFQLYSDSATGKLTIYAIGFDGTTDPDPRADAPAVKVKIREASHFDLNIVQIPGYGGRKRPICVEFGDKVYEGCGSEWKDFESNKGQWARK